MSRAGAAEAAALTDRIDLSDIDAFTERVSYEWFDTLRRSDPVHWQPERQGRGFWAVTSHADVLEASRDWATFSSETGASALEDLAADALAARRSMIDTDPRSTPSCGTWCPSRSRSAQCATTSSLSL